VGVVEFKTEEIRIRSRIKIRKTRPSRLGPDLDPAPDPDLFPLEH
jgi:hypothetical protein